MKGRRVPGRCKAAGTRRAILGFGAAKLRIAREGVRSAPPFDFPTSAEKSSFSAQD
jgi:hypothetical protein